MGHRKSFSFKRFVRLLRKSDKHKIVEDFEEVYGSIEGKRYEELPFYEEYVSKFKDDAAILKRLMVPEVWPTDFDYKLLCMLVAASFSSSYDFEYDEDSDKVRLLIMVARNGKFIWMYLDELWSFQIHRLFNIYFEEQLQLATLMSNSLSNEKAIEKKRETHLMVYDMKYEDVKWTRELCIQTEEIKEELDKLIEIACSPNN